MPLCGGVAHAKCSNIDITAGPLDRALLSLASQTGADIVSTEVALRSVQVMPLRGCLTTARALDRLMRGTGYRAVSAGGGSYRIVRARIVRERAPVLSPLNASQEVQHIIVTGTKHQVPLLRFPGSVQIIDVNTPQSRGIHNPSLNDVARMTPVMQKTELGVGRNKLFIRGISDSSFNGPTQSTATVYYGDVQLNYSGPQPALNLYDMERVEILEGPQETLYGAGAISGIIRMTPRSVDLLSEAASAAAGVTLTQGGGTGFDTSAMVNLPMVRDKIGLRLVGYRLRDGGYIDDPLRMVSNVNRTDTVGGRATLRIEPGDGWTIVTGLVGQRIDADDANYAETMTGPLRRRSAIAQPYASGIWLARAVASKSWDSGLRLLSATGLVKTTANDMFDASRLFPLSFTPTIYRVDNDGLLLSHETRLSRSTPNGVSWVGGIALLYDRSAQSRVFGWASVPVEIIGVTNITQSASLFGEATLPILPQLSVMIGARASIAQTQGEPSITPREQPTERGLLLKRVEPAVAVSWLFAPDVAAFARFQSGYRTGGIAVARGIGRVANFRSDSIRVAELGVRKQRRGAHGLAFSSAVSFSRWSDIQADLFSRRSQPYTDNIGDADIVALEGSGDWIPVDDLQLSFALLWTKDRTTGALAGTSPTHNRHMPDTPSFSGNFGIEYRIEASGGHRVEIGANARYVGRSVLGAGDFLDLSQGNYLVTGLSGSWQWRNLEASLLVDNLTNQADSQFAMGNPLTFGSREQTVPVRPRSIRLGLAVNW
ncbi:TonB-dependent receptor [Sphingobium nicotianae]|uniref:TonB-dependent receptor n=1 Tax=Sphingobium nicotianae TaxID=2782607 RepID=A0A9X1DC54_9SPHN|nr:TonB-dependent receptor [Sphingobium nicotianae]MBT2186963.1 TonB-dependent receptor [Sphingobium nicotianae]